MPQAVVGPQAKVILDSISPDGHRLTTFEVVCHRYIWPEFLTHRAFSRNAASNRARPVRKVLEDVEQNPAIPLVFLSEQAGMQGGEPLSPQKSELARTQWLEARDDALKAARRMATLGVHKSTVNRLLEPFSWHTAIMTATDLDDFFAQRCHPDAQVEIQVPADSMYEAFQASTPNLLRFGQWHTPYIRAEDWAALPAPSIETICQVSVARCARVSYLTHAGTRDLSKDLELYERLTTARPPHFSPLEHVATPSPSTTLGNFTGWSQLRHSLTRPIRAYTLVAQG